MLFPHSCNFTWLASGFCRQRIKPLHPTGVLLRAACHQAVPASIWAVPTSGLPSVGPLLGRVLKAGHACVHRAYNKQHLAGAAAHQRKALKLLGKHVCACCPSCTSAVPFLHSVSHVTNGAVCWTVQSDMSHTFPVWMCEMMSGAARRGVLTYWCDCTTDACSTDRCMRETRQPWLSRAIVADVASQLQSLSGQDHHSKTFAGL